MENTLVNKVSQSGLINLNLENWYPEPPIAILDMKQFLYMGLIVKEKEFRENLNLHDWGQYKNQIVVVDCSIDTILPVWAKMLISIQLEGKAHSVHFGSINTFLYIWYKEIIDTMDISMYTGQRIIVKGCTKREIPDSVFAYLSINLKPVVRSIMFGEACSNVPIYKKRKYNFMDIQQQIKQPQFKSAKQKAHVNLIYTFNYLSYSMKIVFKEYQIFYQHYNVLKILKGAGGKALCNNDILDVMLDKTRDLTRLIDKLEEFKWVTKKQIHKIKEV